MKSTIFRKEIIRGISVPTFICNGGDYFFTDLNVYEDGVVYCWEFTDLEQFKQKIHSGWVKPLVEKEKMISIYNLGGWKLKNMKWLHNPESFYQYIRNQVKQMNPDWVNIYTYIPQVINGVKYGEKDGGIHYIQKQDTKQEWKVEEYQGKSMNLFYQENNKYYLVQLVVYKNETIRLLRLPKALDINFNELDKLIREERIVSELPINAEVEIYGLGSFQVQEGSGYSIPIQDKRLEINDLLLRAQNKPDSIQICADLYEEYIKQPSQALVSKLRLAYEAIPEHNRIYVGNMDTQDILVRMIIYRDQMEDWEIDRIKNTGYKFPPEPMNQRQRNENKNNT